MQYRVMVDTDNSSASLVNADQVQIAEDGQLVFTTQKSGGTTQVVAMYRRWDYVTSNEL